jgi:YfiH family protein
VGDDPLAVLANRRLLRERLALPAEPRWLAQVHGVEVADASESTTEPPVADACTALRPGRVCVVLTADCLPVVLAARDGSAVAVAHCGWRGLVAGILGHTVQRLPVAPGRLVAWLGPAIGPAAFEVGPEVREAFLAQATDRAAVGAAFTAGDRARERWYADIFELARCSLRALGVESIEGGGQCTVSDPDRFYSYRRDGQTGRFATLAWIDPAQSLR